LIAWLRKVSLRGLVAVAAHVLRHPLPAGMAHLTGRPGMGTDQWYGVELWRQRRLFKAGWRVALLTVGPKVRLTWRLVAVGALVLQRLACNMAGTAL
jgi:hypothetical protein